MKKITSIALFLFIGLNLFSQVEVNITDIIITVQNKKYYAHKVETGQTLYSICKAYNVAQKEVVDINKLESASLDAGQILKIPYKEIQINKIQFYEHKVAEGETLFSLSKKYEVSINDIIKYNPEARYGIKTNEILKIPNKKGDENISKEFHYHTVIQGNTLYSISQSYGIEIEDIIRNNPGSKNGIQTGQVLKIPKSINDITEIVIANTDTLQNDTNIYAHLYFEDEGVTPCKDFVFDKSMKFNIVLMLPLYLSKNIYFLGNYKEEKDKMFYKRTERFIAMYEGMFIALNELKAKGISMNIEVYDTENKANVVKEIMDKLDYSKVDLIIGPIYSSNLKIAAEYAKKNHINIISPLSQNTDIAIENPFVYQVMPSYETGIKNTSQMLKEFRDSTFLFIHNGTEREKKLLSVYTEKLKESFFTEGDTQQLNVKIVDYSKGGSEAIKNALVSGRQNIAVIPSVDEVFVTQAIDNLYAVIENYDIKLIGSPIWERFQNINFDQLKNLSFNYISPYFINYSDKVVKNFLTEFRAVYETEPSHYAFHGYDIMKFFGNALRMYGKHFQFCLSHDDILPDHKGLSFEFNFQRVSENGGFENSGTFFLEYDEIYQLKLSDIQKNNP